MVSALRTLTMGVVDDDMVSDYNDNPNKMS